MPNTHINIQVLESFFSHESKTKFVMNILNNLSCIYRIPHEHDYMENLIHMNVMSMQL